MAHTEGYQDAVVNPFDEDRGNPFGENGHQGGNEEDNIISPRYSDYSAYSLNGETADSEEAPSPSLRVSQHFFDADGINYNEHYYVVEIKVNEIQYSVDRNVLDFVELDRKLRKRFGSLDLEPLPFNDGAMSSLRLELERCEKERQSATRKLPDRGSEATTGGDSAFSPTRVEGSTSYTASSPSKSTVKQLNVANTERMDKKMQPLGRYLQALLLHHEVIVAEEFALFFDEEAPSMAVHPSSLEPLTIHDILLLDEPVYKCIVRKKEDVEVSASPGELVVWRFATQDFDLGFGVDLNGEGKISNTRYNSHLKPVCGTLLVNPRRTPENEDGAAGDAPGSRGDNYPEKSICTLKFDNSYAKLHTKKLQWSARVVSYEEYTEAKERAIAVMAEKSTFEKQRHGFLRYMIILAMTKGNVIHSSSVREDFLREEALARKAQLREIQQLQVALLEADEVAAGARDKLREVETAAAATTDSWKFAIQELETTKKALEALKAEKEEWSRSKELAEMVRREALEQEERMRAELEVAIKGRKQKETENDQLTSAMELALSQADATVTALEKKLKTANSTIENLRKPKGGVGGVSFSEEQGNGSELSGRINEAIERITVSKRESQTGLKR